MKSTFTFCMIAFFSLTGWSETGMDSKMKNTPANSDKIIMHVGSKAFNLTLLKNEASKTFKKKLPLTIRMQDLNSNEKFYDLPKALPSKASVPDKIKAGDFMLYGSNTLVVFYKSFSTTYSYTKLGQLDDPTNLEAVLGYGDVSITFDFAKP